MPQKTPSFDLPPVSSRVLRFAHEVLTEDLETLRARLDRQSARWKESDEGTAADARLELIENLAAQIEDALPVQGS